MRKFTLFSILLIANSAAADISWESVAETIEADSAEKPLLFTFAGKNTGADTVTIKELRESCPCVEAMSDKTEIAAGESFIVAAEFSPFEIGGTQRQRIMVHFEEVDRPEILTVTAELPELIGIEPKRLFWNAKEEPAAQKIEITLDAENGVELGDVYAMDENFSTSLVPESANTYTLTVLPEDLSVRRPASVMVRFSVDGREMRTLIPCMIGERNPFEFSFDRAIPRPNGAQIKDSILRAGQTELQGADLKLGQRPEKDNSVSEAEQ